MSQKTLVIVESPTKAKTITKFLGNDYTVTASMGHIRDLPNNASEVPAKFKKTPWAKMGINIEQNFEPLYVIPSNKKEQVAKLKEALSKADLLLLATDEDREGESISWHLLDTLNPKIPVKRLVFHEITKEAIQSAIANPRDIDINLVRAQETRRIVDRLFGYEVSPLLWKKIRPKLSAGRVQSVSVRLLVEKERERIKFVSAEYWGLKAKLHKKDSSDTFEAELTHLGKTRIATGKDFDANTGKLKSQDNITLLNEKSALLLKEKLISGSAKVENVEEKPFTNSPPAPFTTSTLQQEANRKLRFSAQRTMRIAQQLYENGFITYMRTDSTTLSDEALNAARSFIKKEYGDNFLPNAPRKYATKVKNAQEAHEAVRPAGANFTPPDVVEKKLGEEAFKLYDLIWKRTVASQMENATGIYVTVAITADDANFRASGKTISFPGFLRAYVEGSDDPDAEIADQEKILPPLKPNDTLIFNNIDAQPHNTLPPARYTEGSLIKELEKRGIGRPSTWASVVELVLSRQYAFKKGTALVPTFTAFAVVGMLEKHFGKLLDYDFTARLEDDLDAISRGESETLSYLKEFYFGNNSPGLIDLVKKGETDIDPRDVCGIPIKYDKDKQVEVRIGKFGPFLSDGETKTGIPDNLAPDELTSSKAEELLSAAEKGPEPIGVDSETGKRIYLKVGRYGPYVQLGEPEGDEKPKMSSLLPGMSIDNVTLEIALKLLSLPKILGKNSETSEDILLKSGPYGPYVECGSERRTIPTDQIPPLEITYDQAVELLKQPKTRGRGRTSQTALKEYGTDPVTNNPIKLLSGRYGPYITNGKVNVSVPRGIDPLTVPVEDVIKLLRDKEASTPEKAEKKPKTKSKKEPKEKPKKSSEKKEKAVKTKKSKDK